MLRGFKAIPNLITSSQEAVLYFSFYSYCETGIFHRVNIAKKQNNLAFLIGLLSLFTYDIKSIAVAISNILDFRVLSDTLSFGALDG